MPLTLAETATVYVTTTGSDANDGLTWATALATVEAALAVLEPTGGIVQLGSGNWTITAADGNGNALTLSHGNTRLKGLGRQLSSITLDLGTQVNWGIKLTAAQCYVEGLVIGVKGTSPYWVCGVGGTSPFSAQSCRFIDVLGVWEPGCTISPPPADESVMPPGFFALGPDNPGKAAMDIANTLFDTCAVDNQSASTTGMAGFVVGNSTAGNVLANEMRSCTVQTCAYGVASGGSGFRWESGNGGMSGNTATDFFLTHGGGDPVCISGEHFENGYQFLTMGYVGPPTAVELDNCLVGNYSGDSNGNLIVFDPAGCLTIRGGWYWTTNGNTKFSMNEAGGVANNIIAIGVLTDVADPFPAKNTARCLRTIIGHQYLVDGTPTPAPGLALVIDGAATLANLYPPYFFSRTISGHGVMDLAISLEQIDDQFPAISELSNVLVAAAEVDSLGIPFQGAASVQVLNTFCSVNPAGSGSVHVRLNILWNEPLNIRLAFTLWP